MLTGGFINQTEAFIRTAKRKIWPETDVDDIFLEQLQAYSLTDDSVENRIASVVYYALIKFKDYRPPVANTHLTQLFTFKQIPALVFDHDQKVEDAINRVKESLETHPLQFYLLLPKFPLNQLQAFYEEVYYLKLDNRNFRKWVTRLLYLEALPEVELNVSHRPAKLYQFNQAKFNEFSRSTQLIAY